MSQNIIIECRQKDCNPKTIYNNGEYESFLANEIIIENGDILQIKNAYIDTKKESSGINIVDDLILSINYGVYMTDWKEDTTNKKEYIDINGNNIWQPPAGTPSDPTYYNLGRVYKGQRFIPYYFINSTGQDYQEVVSVSYKALGMVFGEESPNMPVVYQYIDALSNKPIVIHSTIPASEPNVVYTDNLNFLIKSGSFQIVSPSPNDMETDYYWKLEQENVINVPSTGVYSPYIFTKSFKLPAGNYSPSDLSLFISKALSSNDINPNDSDNIISSDSFVKYVSQFNPNAPYPNGATGNITSDGTYFFSDDLTTRFRFGSNPSFTSSVNYLFGASQMALEFNQDTNTFSWTYCHSPIYDATSGSNISCRIQNIGYLELIGGNGVVIDNYIKTTDNGGVFFTGLSAVNASTNKSFDFWAGLLGFDLSKITASPRTPLKTSGTQEYFGLTGTFYGYNLAVGENITTGYTGIDNSIIKSPSQWYQLISIPKPQNNPVVQQTAIYSTINNTTPLIADVPFTELVDNFSHYIINADLGFIGRFVGVNKYNNIQGLISKYYQTSNYIIGDSSDGFEYFHRGAPILLKSIKIRILKSDKKRDPNLGTDNTIVFQLIKSNKSQY